jgi:glycosyltransferase involved in cell wall biosynthesis
MGTKVSLVALFYNEECSVESVIREGWDVLRSLGVPFEIVAVQNGSTDRTPEILDGLVKEIPELRILKIPVNLGAGYGAVRGWYEAKAEYVIGVAGDGQVDLQSIPRMFELMCVTGADLAYGRRTNRPDGPVRAAISWTYQIIMRMLFGIRSKDMNGAPKIVSTPALQAMRIQSADQFLECEMMLKAQRMGLRICSVDVLFHERRGGSSSVGWRDCLDYVRHLFLIRLGLDRRLGIATVPRFGPQAHWVHCANGVSDLQQASVARESSLQPTV